MQNPATKNHTEPYWRFDSIQLPSFGPTASSVMLWKVSLQKFPLLDKLAQVDYPFLVALPFWSRENKLDQ